MEKHPFAQTEATTLRTEELIRPLRNAEQELLWPAQSNHDIAKGHAPLLPPEFLEKLHAGELAQRHAFEMQMAILNALPAHIALLDTAGVILAVNEAWRRFASANVPQSQDFFVGQNYLSVCDSAQGECAEESRVVAQGIRSVLTGGQKEFALEYPCHSSTEKRWFRLMVTPLNEKHLAGAVVMHVNVTDRRLAAESLTNSQALLRMAGQAARLGGWSIELPDHQLTWTNEICLIHEVPPGETPTFEEAIKFYPPEYREEVARHVKLCAEEGTSFDFEMEIITAKQRRVWVRAIGEAVRDDKKQIRRIQGAFQDISRQKAAEAAAHCAGTRLLETLESITDCFFTLNRDWRFTYVNAEAERLLNCHRSSLLGHEIWEAYPTLVGSVFEKEYRRAVAENCATTFEEYYPPFDMWIEVKAYPTSEGLAVYFRDVTERRRTREALRASESKFRQLADSNVLGIISWDTTGTISEANDAFLGMSGYTREELQAGQIHWRRMTPPEFRTADERALEEIATMGHCTPFEKEYFHKDGHRVAVMVGAAALDGMTDRGVCYVVDISPQKQAEAKVRASEASLLHAQRIARIGNWDWNIVLDELYWSAQVFHLLGLDPQESEVTYKGFLKSVHPEDRERVHEAVLAAVARNAPYNLDHRVLWPDGTVRWMHEQGEVVRDAEGRGLKMSGTVQDITERKLAEAEIRRMTDLLWAVADGIPDALFVKDVMGSYLLFNQGAARLVGKPVTDVLGRDDTAIFGPDEARAVMANDREVMASGKTHMTEEVLTAAGVTRTYHAIKAPYRDVRGNIIGTIGISRDITERKLTENKIREQAALLDKAQDAILVRDLDHKILYWNRSAERLYGWSAAEALGRDARELIYRDTGPLETAIEKVMSCDEWVGEIAQVSKVGEVLTVEGHWSLMRDGQGNPQSILAINTDVTERKKIEAQYLRAQRMESIGTLAGGIAHDLNNVLAPIMMSIELLKMQERDARRLGILTTIEGSAKRGADMVRQVLSFARGVEGQQLEVQVGHLIKEIQKIVEDTFLKNISVRSNIPSDLWLVHGDPTQLHQVLLNLCVNARDAMPNGGTLSLTASNLVLDEHYAGMNIEANPGPHVCIHVEDSGTGMPPEIIERIFEPFFTTKELGKGTGLGLSTTIAIIKSHGGFIRLHSQVGIGTRFEIYLPAHTEPRSGEIDAVLLELPRGNGELVLVIDDEAAVRQITRQTLEAFGYGVVLAVDGVEATSIYATRKQEIAAVLTDMMMPLMDGPTTIKVLQKLNPQVRIIAASGLNANGMVTKAVDVGVQNFLPKPYTAETLLKAVHQLLYSQH